MGHVASRDRGGSERGPMAVKLKGSHSNAKLGYMMQVVHMSNFIRHAMFP